jgi:iron complex transport system substrate-binding protein
MLASVIALALLALPGTLWAEVQVIDSEGRELHLNKPARRIVALAPHIVENLFSIGAGEQIVGAVQYSDYPIEARALPRVGGVGSYSLESIVDAQPDLVILWGSGTPPQVRASLERLGIPYVVNEIRSLDELGAQFATLGAVTGHKTEAARAASAVRRSLQSAQKNGEAGGSVPVFLQIWDDPLQTIGDGHLLSEVISRCGGRSISDDLPGLAPLISLEQVLAADPALIIVESQAQARHWQRWTSLRAVRGNSIVSINPDLLYRPTLRLLEGMTAICEHLAKR